MTEGTENIYDYGDIIEFKVGGFGRIGSISRHPDGYPVEYSVMEVPNMPFHPESKCAWHDEGDIGGLKQKASEELSQVMSQLECEHKESLVAHMMRANE